MGLISKLVLNKAVKTYRDRFSERFSGQKIPHPRIIHVETRSRCNGQCSFCLANVRDDPREDSVMSSELIDKIISELSELRYPNRLSFYNNNEPFLDKRLPEIIRQARDAVPLAYLEIKTNGRSLDIGKVIGVFNSGLDTLSISDYTSDGAISNRIENLKKELNQSRRFRGHFDMARGVYSDRLIITSRQVDSVLGSRGGTAPNKQAPPIANNDLCLRPFEMMTISPDGSVGVCSEDFFYVSNMGSVVHQTIKEIWRSKRYQLYRSNLMNGKRSQLSPCDKCDYKGFTIEGLAEEDIWVSKKYSLPIRLKSILSNYLMSPASQK